MHTHTVIALRKAVLLDLRISQSTASAIAERLHFDTQTIERIAAGLIEDRLATAHTVAEVLTVYRITTRGLETIS